MRCSGWRIGRYNDLFDHLVGARRERPGDHQPDRLRGLQVGGRATTNSGVEHDPGVDGICDEAMGFDAFHGFAGRLEFGFALEGMQLR